MDKQEIITTIEEKLKLIESEKDVADFFDYWLCLTQRFGDWESIYLFLGEVDSKKLACVFDKYSAIFSDRGVDSRICEGMSVIANGLRKGQEP